MATRNTNTKEKIKETFIILINEKGLDSLTVSDIARDAKINRGTFYLHYLDKYDLMEKLEREVIEDLKQIILSDHDPKHLEDPIELIPYNSILQALIYVESDFEFIQALASPGGDPQFMEKIKDILNELLATRLSMSKTLHFSKKEIPEDYTKEILLSSTVSIIGLWIKKGGDRSPEEIASMINSARQISPYELLI